jgi:rhomboid protease GluP
MTLAPDPPPPPPPTTKPAQTLRQQQATRMLEFRRQLEPYTPRVYVTWALIAINVAVWIAMVATGTKPLSPTTMDLLHWGADYAPRTTHGQWWRPFSAMFLHAGIIHLVMNMIVLASIGPFMERLLGNVGFFALYLFAGMTGSLLSLLHAPTVVSVGASGAIFGLYGALVGFLLRSHGTLPKDILQQLLRMAGAFVVYNFLFGLGVKGIDQAAHVGGLVGGFVGGVLLGHPLEPAGFAGRPLRSAILGVVGAALFALAIVGMPKHTDWRAELDSFAAVETRLVATVNDLATKNDAGKVSPEESTRTLEKDVLPEWNAQLRHLRDLHGLDARDAKDRDRIVAYMQARSDGWQLFVDGARNEDAAILAKAREKQALAAELAKKVLE